MVWLLNRLHVRCVADHHSLSEPGVPCLHDGRGPVRHLEFGEHIRYVVADRLETDHEVVGDGCVTSAGGDEVEHVTLACGHGGNGGRRKLCGVGEALDDAVGDAGSENGFACGGGVDGSHDLVAVGAFQQVAVCAGPWRVASMPSRSGIRRSIKMTSGTDGAGSDRPAQVRSPTRSAQLESLVDKVGLVSTAGWLGSLDVRLTTIDVELHPICRDELGSGWGPR